MDEAELMIAFVHGIDRSIYIPEWEVPAHEAERWAGAEVLYYFTFEQSGVDIKVALFKQHGCYYVKGWSNGMIDGSPLRAFKPSPIMPPNPTQLETPLAEIVSVEQARATNFCDHIAVAIVSLVK